MDCKQQIGEVGCALVALLYCIAGQLELGELLSFLEVQLS